MSEQLKSENLQIVALFKQSGKEISSLKFGEAKLKTGEVIMFDGDVPTQGAAIAIQTDQGWLPVPDGMIELEDGTQIEVSGGLIATVKPAEGAAPAEPVTATPAQDMENEQPALSPAQETAVKRTIESVIKETHFTKEEIEEKFNALPKAESFDATNLNNEIEALKKENGELKTKMSAIVELLSKAPKEEPAKVATNAFKAVPTAEDQDEKIMQHIRNLNKNQ